MLEQAQPWRCDVIILGAGYGGLMAALHLGATPSRGRRFALINSTDEFVERIRLQECIVRPVQSQIPSIETLLAGTGIDFVCGKVTALDADARCVTIATPTTSREIRFDRAIYALGSLADLETIPGVREFAYRLDPGDDPLSVAGLRRVLHLRGSAGCRVVVVGGNETAIEAAGEIKTQWPSVDVVMMARGHCGAFKGPRVEFALRAQLDRLGVRIVDDTTVVEVRADAVVAAGGELMPCDVCVWCGGLRASPIAARAGLATDRHGRIFTDPMLRSISHPHIFAVGDAAHPLAPTGAPYRLSAFAALVTGAYVADVLNDEGSAQHRPFSFSTFGQGVAVGRYGVGFDAFPDDLQRFFVIRGRTGHYTRNFFVWLVANLLKLERKFPGLFSFVWFGQRRVTWQQANHAMQNVRQSQPA
jgi:NADH dehydrogenase FAD-containing subunit